MPANLQELLRAADDKKDDYVPSRETARQVRETSEVLGSLIGVTGIGKSYLIPWIVRLGGSEFSEVENISSRAKRPGDLDNFRGSQSKLELLERIRRREVVNYMVHPSGDIYASDARSYTTRYIILPTLTTALPQLQRSGCFREVKPIGIVTDGATWEQERLDDVRDSVPRMREALACINWLKAHADTIPILDNATGEEKVTAQTIVDIMRDPSPSRPLANRERIALLLGELEDVALKHLRRLERLH